MKKFNENKRFENQYIKDNSRSLESYLHIHQPSKLFISIFQNGFQTFFGFRKALIGMASITTAGKLIFQLLKLLFRNVF